MSIITNVIKHEVVECHDPSHLHVDPRIEMWGVDYQGHYVEITSQDGTYGVRIDENEFAPTGMDFDEAMRYIDHVIGG